MTAATTTTAAPTVTAAVTEDATSNALVTTNSTHKTPKAAQKKAGKITNAKHENDSFLGNSLLFGGVSLYSLEQCLSFSMPVFNRVNHTNKFGPGIYVTPSLAYAKHYAEIKRAVLVFRSPDLRNLATREPAVADWKLLVAHHLGL